MEPETKIRPPRKGIAAATALAVIAVTAATALASVTIYDNDFKSKPDFKSVRKAAGGKACDRAWYKQKDFGITIEKRQTECAYEPPIFADGAGADLTAKMIFKVFSENTTSKIRQGAFGFLSLRASNSTRYQLRIFPKAGRWELRRTPASSEFPVKGKLGKIAPLDERNQVQMRITDDTIDAWIQGKRVVKAKVDSDAAEVSGTAIRIGIGQANKAKRPTAGTINSLRVDLPNP